MKLKFMQNHTSHQNWDLQISWILPILLFLLNVHKQAESPEPTKVYTCFCTHLAVEAHGIFENHTLEQYSVRGGTVDL